MPCGPPEPVQVGMRNSYRVHVSFRDRERPNDKIVPCRLPLLRKCWIEPCRHVYVDPVSLRRSQVLELIEAGKIPEERIGDALVATGVVPEARAWRRFIDLLLLWLGGMALAVALVFFIAYNWSELGRFAKFAMVEGLIVLAVAGYWRLGADSAAGKVALLGATIGVGVLLALYGQTYQTGADPWQLFFNWALLVLPWTLIARFPPLWIVWIALINVAMVLYHQTFGGLFRTLFSSDRGFLWATFVFNTLVLLVWEYLAANRRWHSERWAIRLVATAGGVSITWLLLRVILVDDGGGFLPLLAWVLWLIGNYLLYRRLRPDLFMVAGCCLSVMTVFVAFTGRHLMEANPAGAFFLLAIMVIGMSAASAWWLKHLQREFVS